MNIDKFYSKLYDEMLRNGFIKNPEGAKDLKEKKSKVNKTLKRFDSSKDNIDFLRFFYIIGTRHASFSKRAQTNVCKPVDLSHSLCYY